MAHRLRVANVVISNVPGPQVPPYLAGARMTGMYPLSIVVHGIGLNITVQRYMGQLCFGLIACRRAAPDVHDLTERLHPALATTRTAGSCGASSGRGPRSSRGRCIGSARSPNGVD
jgi:diacylglycerol O-acyltransferase